MMVRSRVPLSAAILGIEVVQVDLGRLPGVGSPSRKLGGFADIDVSAGASPTAIRLTAAFTDPLNPPAPGRVRGDALP
jgi:hypothetical protein